MHQQLTPSVGLYVNLTLIYMKCALISHNIQLIVDFEAALPSEVGMKLVTYYQMKAHGYSFFGDRRRAWDCFRKAHGVASRLESQWSLTAINLRLSCIDFQEDPYSEAVREELIEIVDYMRLIQSVEKEMMMGRAYIMLTRMELAAHNYSNSIKYAQDFVRAIGNRANTGHFNFVVSFVKLLHPLAQIPECNPRVRDLLEELDVDNSKWRFSKVDTFVWALNLSVLYRRLGMDDEA